MPTVAADKPDRREYTGSGSVLPTLEMPKDKAYIPKAPGKLLQQSATIMHSPRIRSVAYQNMEKAAKPPTNPLWTVLMQKSILVLAEPGRDWEIAKIC